MAHELFRSADESPARPRRAKANGVMESRPEVAGVAISNPGKLLVPDAGITKLQLARYYEAVGDWIVPHLKNRPLTLVRCPDGWDKQCFYQRHADKSLHKSITPVTVEESAGPASYMMANSAQAVVAMLQMGALEFHPWGATAKKLGHPDRIVFDFDPDEALGWRDLVEGARLLRTRLEALGLEGFLKTTGGKGLHVVIPIQPVQDWETVKRFTRTVAEGLAVTFPERFTAKAAKAERRGKIYVDYLRNAAGATAVSAYSMRARANAPVATPIAWEELAKDVRFDHFSVRTVPARLRRMTHDPWKDFFSVSQRITVSMLEIDAEDRSAS